VLGVTLASDNALGVASKILIVRSGIRLSAFTEIGETLDEKRLKMRENRIIKGKARFMIFPESNKIRTLLL